MVLLLYGRMLLSVEGKSTHRIDCQYSFLGCTSKIRIEYSQDMAGTAPPRGSAAADASLRRRRTTSVGAAGGTSGTSLQFYTNDAPGLKISPNVVLTMSVVFIAFVALLHEVGKLWLVQKN